MDSLRMRGPSRFSTAAQALEDDDEDVAVRAPHPPPSRFQSRASHVHALLSARLHPTSHRSIFPTPCFTSERSR